jgi:hypothetical protein
MRRGAVFVALALFAGVLAVGAPKTQALLGTTQALNTLACLEAVRLCTDTDKEWAQRLEGRIADNTYDGQVYEIDYHTAQRVLGDVGGVGAFADSALWTGTYLGSQSFRYALAKKYLAQTALPGGDRLFWNQQKAQAKARIADMVRKFHILINISQHWDHELDPQIVPPSSFGFGGGIIQGEPGYLMRACIDRATIDANPTSASPETAPWPGDPTGKTPWPEDPSKPDFHGWSTLELDPTSRGLPPPYTAKRRVFGPFPWDGKEYFCEDGTSRDAYAGTIFGLLVAFDLYSGDDPALRTQIRDDIVTLSNFAFKYLWNTPRPHGKVSIPIDSNHDSETCSQINALIDICGHDFENFFSPLFIITPTAQMEMTQAAYHVVTQAPGHPDTTKWKLLWDTELATLTPFLAFSELFDSTAPYDSYYKWNLEHLIAYNLIRQAPNALGKTVFKQAFSVMDASTNNDINAHFEAVSYAITGEPKRLMDSIVHLRQWREYRTHIDAGADGDRSDPPDGVPDVDNERFCRTTLDCVPQDQVDVTLTPGVDPIVVPGISSDLRAHTPLPVERRTPTDFLWQRPPNQLFGSQNVNHQAPGIDYLLPYWMIRYLTEANTPALAPYPPWPGPSFN